MQQHNRPGLWLDCKIRIALQRKELRIQPNKPYPFPFENHSSEGLKNVFVFGFIL